VKQLVKTKYRAAANLVRNAELVAMVNRHFLRGMTAVKMSAAVVAEISQTVRKFVMRH